MLSAQYSCHLFLKCEFSNNTLCVFVFCLAVQSAIIVVVSDMIHLLTLFFHFYVMMKCSIDIYSRCNDTGLYGMLLLTFRLPGSWNLVYNHPRICPCLKRYHFDLQIPHQFGVYITYFLPEIFNLGFQASLREEYLRWGTLSSAIILK
jgi:hypothetical protein